jgi:hypothetical protein
MELIYVLLIAISGSLTDATNQIKLQDESTQNVSVLPSQPRDGMVSDNDGGV